MAGADGHTLYFMTNPDSIATYGVIQKAGMFKDIAPLTNSPASKEIASNALYDVAHAWLDRNSIAQYTYSITLKKVSRVIRPGDKILKPSTFPSAYTYTDFIQHNHFSDILHPARCDYACVGHRLIVSRWANDIIT